MRKKLLMILIQIIVLSFIISSPTLVDCYVNSKQIRSYNLSNGLIPHTSIIITSDVEFDSYDFPGNGTVDSPYLIQNYSIITTGQGISISGTSRFFEIQNCYIESSDDTAIFINSVASGTVSIVGNYIRSNSKSALNIWNGCHYSSIINNTIVATWGCIDMFNCDNSNIIGNNMSNSGSGVRVQWSDNCIITNNTCNNNLFTGLFTGFSASCHIANNTVRNNGYEGIPTDSGDNSLIADNFCENNGWYNIFCISTDSLEIYNNTCIGSDNGIVLDGSYHKVKDNYCMRSKYNGMNLEYTDNSVINGNILLGNQKYGVALNGSGCSDNNVTQNYFVANNFGGTSQAFDDGQNNSWYDKSKTEGNYWSDWNLIGNYSIDGLANSEDIYPAYINDTIPPVFLPQPGNEDLVFFKGEIGHTITWKPFDRYPKNYSITGNNVLFDSGEWNGGLITLNLDGLDEGTYLIICTVSDFWNNTVSDEVDVTVMSIVSEYNQTSYVIIIITSFLMIHLISKKIKIKRAKFFKE